MVEVHATRKFLKRACRCWILAALLVWSAAVSGLAAAATEAKPASATTATLARDLTFFVVSDTHYGLSPRGDEVVPGLVDMMNALPGTPYPAEMGGKVGVPRGVIHIGDSTNDGKAEQWERFLKDYGLDGKDGRLKFPVYETFGNHDGGKNKPVRDGIKARNLRRVGVGNVSGNGMHYSWDWDGIHFVCLGISPGTTKNPYDPENSTEFLAEDLKAKVGDGRRPVILLHHFGFDKEHSWGWWPDEWKTQYRDVIQGRNILAILHGHAHRPFIYQWEGFDVYHPPHFRQDKPKENGPVSHGIFVFHVTGDKLTVAERKLDGTWGMTASKPVAR